MKSRNGFVSNSSSSSFVILGVKIRKGVGDKALLERMFEPDVLESIASDEYQKSWADVTEKEAGHLFYDLLEEAEIDIVSLLDGDQVIVGDKLGRGDDCGYMETSFSPWSEMAERAAEIAEQFKGLYDGDVGLHVGTESC